MWTKAKERFENSPSNEPDTLTSVERIVEIVQETVSSKATPKGSRVPSGQITSNETRTFHWAEFPAAIAVSE